MSHRHWCDAASHEYECTNPHCECICGTLMEVGDHSDCPIELRPCLKHEEGITPAEAEAVKEAGAVPIQFPSDVPEKLRRPATDSQKYVGYCVWCGHGYTDYSSKAELEHFAYNCPNAPEDLKEDAKRRLEFRRQKGCR